ncbi:superfamily II DNA or RNA helicase [Brevibacterium pityocampae]
MNAPHLSTYREIKPVIYSWSTPDVPKYDGWEKIGYTDQQTAADRIAQQASQMNVAKDINWTRKAFFTSEGADGSFTDHQFHRYLKQQGVERELKPKRTEWHRLADMPRRSIDYFNDFAGQDFTDLQVDGQDVYQLRPEQEAAVQQALEAFGNGATDVLWNAKPRFGKTLTTYDLMRRLDVIKALIVTNRPAIANSWYDDFVRFIGHQTTFKFVSESPALATRSPMTRAQYRSLLAQEPDATMIEFLSLQDLKGSQYFGGEYDKLRHVADLEWDLLVIDEAHEGIDTDRTDVAFDHIHRAHTLHLSGTPFRALASGKFAPEEIYNWTYADERQALQAWDDEAEDNPYAALPKLNMYTYQVSRMISDQLEVGVALAEDEANIDYAFDLGEFFATKENGYFEHEAEVMKFLDCLTTNEKYPFSTPELRDEIQHSFWLLDRVDSAKALERILKNHAAFKDYTIVLAAGDGRSADADVAIVGRSLDRVRSAIAEAEKTGGRTITLSVGQLTTGVTVPEWTAVIMLSNITSPALYMQAAFRAQNPHAFERNGQLLQKQNAYIFDFAPERTLTIYDQFANNLSPRPSITTTGRQDNIRTLLNFFPVIGEDSEGRMVELDASQVLTFPQVFKAREVVRRGFLSNLLFDNVAGIFRYSEHLKDILDKLPTAKAGKLKKEEFANPEPPIVTDTDGSVQVDAETVINPKIEHLGKPVWDVQELAAITPDTPRGEAVKHVVDLVTQKLQPTRDELKEMYGLSAKQAERDEKAIAERTRAVVERKMTEQSIADKHLEARLAEAATEAEANAIEVERKEQQQAFSTELFAAIEELTGTVPTEFVTREETKKEQTRANTAMEDARSHLRGFARTIPMFLMAYGQRGVRLSNFDEYTPDDVFEEVTGITEEEFRVLRDGQVITEDDGTTTTIPGLFDEAVFDQSIQEFLDKKKELADYFDDSLTEDIFAYIPQQKTSLVFTPHKVVTLMVDLVEDQTPGIFNDPTKTFADLFSTAGLFLMELVKRLDDGLTDVIPDKQERLRHILTQQLFEMSHNEILHRITIEAVSGGDAQRKQWIEESGHYIYGDIARMRAEQRQQVIDRMLSEKE